MKFLLPILISLLLVSCGQEEEKIPFHERDNVPLYVELAGQCKDLEPPSSFKNMSSYEVNGAFWVSCWREEECRGVMSINTTKEERDRREQLRYELYPNNEYYQLPTYERYRVWQLEDTPFIKVYSLSEEIFKEDVWRFDAYHSYIGDDDEDHNLYGMNKASCELEVTSKKGVVTPELRGKIDWCTDFDCVNDKLMKKRMAPDAKTFEGYIEGISSHPAAIQRTPS